MRNAFSEVILRSCSIIRDLRGDERRSMQSVALTRPRSAVPAAQRSVKWTCRVSQEHLFEWGVGGRRR